MQSDSPHRRSWPALANRDDLTPPRLSCGFEDLPHVRLTRSVHPTRGHWASTRLAPPGFTAEGSWRLLRTPEPGTKLLYECQVGGHNLLSPDVGCETLVPLGPVGYVYEQTADGRLPLHRCRVASTGDHFVSSDPACEGQAFESLLGSVLP